jgi:hypothetical protein
VRCGSTARSTDSKPTIFPSFRFGHSPSTSRNTISALFSFPQAGLLSGRIVVEKCSRTTFHCLPKCVNLPNISKLFDRLAVSLRRSEAIYPERVGGQTSRLSFPWRELRRRSGPSVPRGAAGIECRDPGAGRQLLSVLREYQAARRFIGAKLPQFRAGTPIPCGGSEYHKALWSNSSDMQCLGTGTAEVVREVSIKGNVFRP